jgi:hypothetical protein
MDAGKMAEQPWRGELRRVDLRGLRPGGPGWLEAGALDGELRQDLFGRAMPELFALPLAVKQGTLSGGSRIGGYIGPDPVKAPSLESLRISEATDAGKVHAFTNHVWPDGNIAFW